MCAYAYGNVTNTFSLSTVTVDFLLRIIGEWTSSSSSSSSLLYEKMLYDKNTVPSYKTILGST